MLRCETIEPPIVGTVKIMLSVAPAGDRGSARGASGGEMKLLKLEAMRGFAALYVVLHHVVPHDLTFQGIEVGHLFRFGQEAVILFFLVSGFVINYSYTMGRDKSFGLYFFNRATRIYIPLLVIYVMGYAIECFRVAGLADPKLKDLLLNVLMLQDMAALKPNVIVSSYMHNTPLWSLSYEWWFYMLFFPIVTIIKTPRTAGYLVFGLSIAAALLYVVWPTFAPRLLMYMAIWWAGAHLAQAYMDKAGRIGLKDFLAPVAAIGTICAVLAVDNLLHRAAGGALTFGVHPFLELRHFAFSLVVLVGAYVWMKARWVLFDRVFGLFALAAPISYSVYISHKYLVANATYLAFLNSPILEFVLYSAVMVAFCIALEIYFYPWVRRALRPMVFRQAAESQSASGRNTG